MRLNYVPDSPQFKDPEDQAIVDRIKARRPGSKLLELDQTLLLTPPIANGWNSFLGAVRSQPSNSLPDSICQVAITRTVALNRAWFAWTAHHDFLLTSTDTKITTPAIEYILTASPKSAHTQTGIGGLEEKHMAVIDYVDYITKELQVPDEVFGRVKRCGFSDREIAEITLSSCAYNCTTRFLWALNVGEGIEYGEKAPLPKDKDRRGKL